MLLYQGPQEEQRGHELGTLTDVIGQLTDATRVPLSLRQLKVLWNHFCTTSSSALLACFHMR